MQAQVGGKRRPIKSKSPLSGPFRVAVEGRPKGLRDRAGSAVDEAVLQATTRALMPRANSDSAARTEYRATVSALFVP